MNRIAEFSRRRFLKTIVAGAALAPGLAVFGADVDHLRGDRVGWVRLKTSSPYWKRHAAADPILTKFFHDETTLNIDPIWYAADVSRMSELCEYPLLFSQNVAAVTDQASQDNITEYIRRGGFILVDACCNRRVTPDFDVFLEQHVEFFGAILPESRLVLLPPTHDIYRCHFQIPDGKPPHTFDRGVYDPHKAQFGLHAVMIGGRVAGLVDLCGLQCGWDRVTENACVAPAGHEVACMEMLVNIYIYAMMQGT
jgi:Domain of unknown function (DUF4159)